MWEQGGVERGCDFGGGGGRMSHNVPAGAVAQVKSTFPPGNEWK